MNFVNEHGNTPLHYACFWGYADIAEDLIGAGALVTIQVWRQRLYDDFITNFLAEQIPGDAPGQVRGAPGPAAGGAGQSGRAGHAGQGVQGPELARPQDQEQGRHPLQAQGHQHQRVISTHENCNNVRRTCRYVISSNINVAFQAEWRDLAGEVAGE